MADQVSIKLQGIDGLRRTFKSLPDVVELRATVFGVRRGAVMVRRALRQAAPKRSGNLKKAIKYFKAKTKNRKGRVLFGVGIARGSGAFYGRFMESGTKNIRATKWASRAWRKVRGQVLKEILAVTEKRIGIETEKLAKRNSKKRRGR